MLLVLLTLPAILDFKSDLRAAYMAYEPLETTLWEAVAHESLLEPPLAPRGGPQSC